MEIIYKSFVKKGHERRIRTKIKVIIMMKQILQGARSRYNDKSYGGDKQPREGSTGV